MPRQISKRQARDLFRAAKIAEQQMYPAAQRHHDKHGTWPADYLAAKDKTARAFERYQAAGYFTGLTVED